MSSPSIDTKIALAIKARVQEVKLGGQTLEKAMPAQPYSPKTDARGDPLPYLSVGKISSPPVRLQIASGKERTREGTVVLTLVHPLLVDQSGNSVPEEAYIERASLVASYFREDSRMSYGGVCLRVTSEPTIQDGYQDSGYWRVPIIVNWRAIA